MHQESHKQSIDYGDVIYISINNNIIYSNGFYDPSLYLINFDSSKQIAFSNCLFRITPYIQEHKEEEKNKIDDQLDHNYQDDIHAAKNHTNKEEHHHGLTNSKWENQISIRVKKEIIEEKYGKPVRYGDKVQLLHIESQEFIKLSDEHDLDDPDLLLSKVTKSSSEAYFIVTSNDEKENDPVLTDEYFHLISSNSQFRFTQGIKIDHIQKFDLEEENEKKYPHEGNKQFEQNKIHMALKRPNALSQVNEVYSVGLKHISPPFQNQYVRFEIFSKYQDELNAHTVKILRVGDYIRIKNGKSYLANLEQGPSHRFYFHDQATLSYKYNYISSIFQLVEMTNELPKANIIYTQSSNSFDSKYDRKHNHDETMQQNKKYLLKHMMSGKLFQLPIDSKESCMKELTLENFVSKPNPIKENSNFRISFGNALEPGKNYFYLAKSSKRCSTNYQDNVDTLYLCGSKFPQNFMSELIGLEKFPLCLMSAIPSIEGNGQIQNAIQETELLDNLIRTEKPEKFNIPNQKDKMIQEPKEQKSKKMKKNENDVEMSAYDPKLCDLSFEFVPKYELYYVNQLESLADHLAKILSIILDEDKMELISLENILRHAIEACDIIFYRSFESDLLHHEDKKVRVQDLKILKQILLRELGIFEMIYNIFLCFVIKLKSVNKLNTLVNNNDNYVSSFQKTIFDNKFMPNSTDEYRLTDLIAKLLMTLSKIINHSISEPHNRLLSSFLLRIFFNLYFDAPEALKKSSLFSEMQKEIMKTCRRIMWQENPDGIKQIEIYFKQIMNTVISHNNESAPLKLIKKAFSNRYPSSLNRLRGLFINSLINNDGIFNSIAPKISRQNNQIVFQFYQNDSKTQCVTLTVDTIKESNNQIYYKYLIQWLKTIISIMEKGVHEMINKIVRYYDFNDLTYLLTQSLPSKLVLLIASLILTIYLVYTKTILKWIPELPNLYFLNQDKKTSLINNLSTTDDKIDDISQKANIPKVYFSDLKDFLKDTKIVDMIKILFEDTKKWLKIFEDYQENQRIIHQAHLEKKKSIISQKRLTELNKLVANKSKYIAINNDPPPLFTSSLIYLFFSIQKIHYYHLAKDLLIYGYALAIEYLNLASVPGICEFSSKKVNDFVMEYKKLFERNMVQLQIINVINEANKYDHIRLEDQEQDKKKKHYTDSFYLEHESKMRVNKKNLYMKLASDDQKPILYIDRYLDQLLDESIFKGFDGIRNMFSIPDTANSIHSAYSTVINFMNCIHVHDLAPLIDNLKHMAYISKDYLSEMMYIIFLQNENDVQAIQKMAQLYKKVMELKYKMNQIEDGTNKNHDFLYKILEDIEQNLESVFEIIYNIEEHFEYDYDKSKQVTNEIPKSSSSNMKLEFWKIFKSQNFRNVPFKIRSKAVNSKYQKMLLPTHLAKVLIDILKNLTFFQNFESKNKPDEQLANLIKLINAILSIFVHRNELNQKYLAQSPSFSEIYTLIQYGFKSKYSDSLMTFFEITKANNNKLGLSQYLMNDMLAQYIEVIKLIPELNVIDHEYPLPAILNGLHFLFYAYKKQEITEFVPNAIQNLLLKFLNNEDFNIARLLDENYELQSNKIILNFHESFYSIKSLLQEIRFISKDDIFEFNRFMRIDPEVWKILLLDNSVLINFDLKNEILNTIRTTIYNKNIKPNLINNFNDFIVYISIIFWDILYYLIYVTKQNPNNIKNDEDNNNDINYTRESKLRDIEKIKDYLIYHMKFTKFPKHENIGNQLKNINLIYEQYFNKYNINNIILNINYQNISFIKSWEDYIFDSCLGLLLDLMLFDGEHFVRYFEENLSLKNEEIVFSNFVKITIYLIKLLTMHISSTKKTLPIFSKIQEGFQKLLFIDQYALYKEDIENICKQFNSNSAIVSIPSNINAKDPIRDTENDDIMQQLQKGLKEYVERSEEKHLSKLATTLRYKKDTALHLIHYLQGEPEKYPHFSFILKVLRKCLEVSNKSHPNIPIHYWESIHETELKDLQHVQNNFREYGLTSQLFNLLKTHSDHNIFYEGCLLLKAYMYGGNRRIQKEFYDLCSKDHNNIFMRKFSSLLITNIDNLKTSASYDFLHSEETIYKHLNIISEAIKSKDGGDIEISSDSQIHIPLENLKILFSTLEGFCEGEYQEFQRFLKNQVIMGSLHPKSFNFLDYIKEFCSHVHKMLNHKTIEISIIVFDVLYEMTNGDINGNMQDLIKDKGFIEEVSELLSSLDDKFNKILRGFSIRLRIPHMNYSRLKSHIISLFKNLTENSDPIELHHMAKYLNIHGMLDFLINQIFEYVDMKKMHMNKTLMIANKLKKAVDVSEHIKNNKLKGKFSMDDLLLTFDMIIPQDYFRGSIPNIMNIYFILRYLWSEEEEFEECIYEVLEIKYNTPFETLNFNQQVLITVLFKILPTITANIEVNIKERQRSLLKIWFPKLPSCNTISIASKTKFLSEVDRTNGQTKLLGLMNSTEIMTSQMESEFKSKHNKIGISYVKFYKYLDIVANITALVLVGINIGTLIANPFPVAPDLEFPAPNIKIDSVQPDRAFHAIRTLCAMQIVIASILVFINLWFYRKERVSIQWVEHTRKFRQKSGRLSFQTENKVLQGDYKQLRKSEALEIIDYFGPGSFEFKKVKMDKNVYNSVKSYYWFFEILYSFKSKELLWDILFLAICVLSLAHHVVIPFQCLDVAFRSYTIERIVIALFKNASQLLWTTILLIIFVLIYSLFTFFDFNGDFTDPAAGDLCADAYQCFWMVFNLSLRAVGGLGAIMSVPDYDRYNNTSHLIGRVFFDLSFFIFVIIITLHIVFGMMVDAFSDLREEENEHLEDQENICFICGLERSEYEKYGNFEEHTEEEHSIWNYLFYIMYLEKKKHYLRNSLTEIEELVYKKYRMHKCDWFPYQNSLSYTKLVEMKNIFKDTDEMEEMLIEVENLKNEVTEWLPIQSFMKKVIDTKKNMMR